MDYRRLGFIGTGQIGEPMVDRLLLAGYPVSVFARRPEVRERLAAAGATVVADPRELADVDVLVACLFDDGQIQEVCVPAIEQLRPGALFVTHTTGSPKFIRHFAASVAARGVGVVDASFSGNADAIRRGELTVMLGGDADHVDVAEQVVGSYANNIRRTGPLGSALSVKLLNNLLFAACTQLTLTAIDAANSQGIDENEFLRVLSSASGGSAAAEYLSQAPVSAAEFAERLPHYLSKDVAAARASASDLDLDIEDLVAATKLGPLELHPADMADASVAGR